MKLRLERVHDVPAAWVRDFLGRRGWSPDFIEWKYFDDRFNRGRDRGIVWVEGDRVRGMVGMIPARIAHGGETWPFSWACDWTTEVHETNPGLGVFVFRKAAETGPRYFGIGGNEFSLRYFPRLAERTFPEAALELHIVLRLEAVLEKAGRRFPALRLDRWPLVGRLPVPRRGRRRGPGIPVRTEEGVAGALAPLLEAPRGPGWHPVYDREHVDWAIGRSPAFLSATTFAPDASGTRAAVLFWRMKKAARRWHAALWMKEDSRDALGACLTEALRQVDARGGALLTVMVSRKDFEFLEVLRAHGAIPRKRIPFFLFRSDQALAGFEEPARLSYHDSDYALKF